jgi:hypothetical protein
MINVASRVLRVLLMRTSEWWVADGDAGFRLTNPQSLLTEWAEIFT